MKYYVLAALALTMATAACGGDQTSPKATPTATPTPTVVIAKGTRLTTADYDIYVGDVTPRQGTTAVEFPIFVKKFSKPYGTMSCILFDANNQFLASSVGPISAYTSGVATMAPTTSGISNAKISCTIDFVKFPTPAAPTPEAR